MKWPVSLKAGIVLIVSAAPSAACDPEEMINELRAQCRDVIASAVTLMKPMTTELSAGERVSVEAKIKETTMLCNADRYRDGYIAAAKLSRFIGHVEARKGVAPVL
jgi:hypothetical protein